jgi:hypothetical protein
MQSIRNWLDSLIIVGAMGPGFILGLRFWTAPAYLKYSLKTNALVAPAIVLSLFAAHHSDVILMGVLVSLMNFYVFWYHIDPPQTEFAGGKYLSSRYSSHFDCTGMRAFM